MNMKMSSISYSRHIPAPEGDVAALAKRRRAVIESRGLHAKQEQSNISTKANGSHGTKTGRIRGQILPTTLLGDRKEHRGEVNPIIFNKSSV